MSTVTEVAIFRRIIEEPITIQLNELNVATFLAENTLDSSAQQIKEQDNNKPYVKLLHQAWSGSTKYLRQACHVKHQTIEFPGLGLLLPRVVNLEKGRLTADTLEKVEETNEIALVVDQKFMDDNELKIGNKNDLVITQDQAEQEYSQQI